MRWAGRGCRPSGAEGAFHEGPGYDYAVRQGMQGVSAMPALGNIASGTRRWPCRIGAIN
jgi:hypothetical protein